MGYTCGTCGVWVEPDQAGAHVCSGVGSSSGTGEPLEPFMGSTAQTVQQRIASALERIAVVLESLGAGGPRP